MAGYCPLLTFFRYTKIIRLKVNRTIRDSEMSKEEGCLKKNPTLNTLKVIFGRVNNKTFTLSTLNANS